MISKGTILIPKVKFRLQYGISESDTVEVLEYKSNYSKLQIGNDPENILVGYFDFIENFYLTNSVNHELLTILEKHDIKQANLVTLDGKLINIDLT